MTIERLGLDEANAFVREHHRHHKPVIGHLFSIGAALEGKIVGVAIVGRPVARGRDDGVTAEVTRLATDGKEIVVDLRRAPMVMEEIAHTPLRADGPLIFSETRGRPWTGDEFRDEWRKIADVCGIPRAVKNMDSRAGAITEATEAGIDLEHIRHAATHSDIGMTQRYARGSEQKIAAVMDARAAHRNKKATSG